MRLLYAILMLDLLLLGWAFGDWRSEGKVLFIVVPPPPPPLEGYDANNQQMFDANNQPMYFGGV